MKKIVFIISCFAAYNLEAVDAYDIEESCNTTEATSKKTKFDLNKVLLKTLIVAVVFASDDHNKSLASRGWTCFANSIAAQTIYSALAVPCFAPHTLTESSKQNSFYKNLKKTFKYFVPAIWGSHLAAYVYKNDATTKILIASEVIIMLNLFTGKK